MFFKFELTSLEADDVTVCVIDTFPNNWKPIITIHVKGLVVGSWEISKDIIGWNASELDPFIPERTREIIQRRAISYVRNLAFV